MIQGSRHISLSAVQHCRGKNQAVFGEGMDLSGAAPPQARSGTLPHDEVAGSGRPVFVHVVRNGPTWTVHGAPAAQFGVSPPTAESIAWARWSWDGQKLVVESCRYGIQPLFYHVGRHAIMVAPSIGTLLGLGAPADLDRAALAVFLRFWNFLGEDTPFREIRAMPPEGRLEWDGKVSIKSRLRIPTATPIDRDKAVQQYATLFRSAVERSAPKRTIVPLSGGRDSRHIALETARLGRLRECITLRHLPPRSDADTKVAAELAALLGTRHVILPPPADLFDAIVDATIETSYCGREHAWFRPVPRYLNQVFRENADIRPHLGVLDGLGGDVLSAGLFLDADVLARFRQGRFSEIAEHYMGGYNGALAFLSDQEIAPHRLAISRLSCELERHQRAPNPIGSFFFWNRTRRVVALQPFVKLAPARAVTPYLDPAVFDFLASLPAEHFLDHRFHTEAIHCAFPEFSRVEFAASDTGGSHRRARQFRQYARAVLNRIVQCPSRLINHTYCLPRCAYVAVSGNIGSSWILDPCLYLNQLEYAAIEARGTRVRGGRRESLA